MAIDRRPRGEVQGAFHALAGRLREQLAAGEEFTCEYRRESSTFARFSRGRCGQVGHVEQAQVEIDLIVGRRHAVGNITLSGDGEEDLGRLRRLLDRLRASATSSAEDPYLIYCTDAAAASEKISSSRLPEDAEVLDLLHRHGALADLVGIYAAGTMQRGFASSFGLTHWHSAGSFHLDWSVFDASERAVKCSLAGAEWEAGEFDRSLQQASEQLELLAQPARELRPGAYRVYLAPAALAEIMTVLSWGGFGLRARKTGTSPLMRLYEGTARFAPSVSLAEDIAGGVAPAFERSGFSRPPRVQLIDAGEPVGCLVSPRSAVEFGAAGNGADAGETPQSLEMAAGTIDVDAIAAQIGRGIFVSNLWYLNFSDRPACRVTGMTRFATLWVEGGRLCGPVDPMRFDDSMYRVLGDNLIGLTRQRALIADADTYGWRSCRSMRLPGALVDGFTLTL